LGVVSLVIAACAQPFVVDFEFESTSSADRGPVGNQTPLVVSRVAVGEQLRVRDISEPRAYTSTFTFDSDFTGGDTPRQGTNALGAYSVAGEHHVTMVASLQTGETGTVTKTLLVTDPPTQ
jgi:hypothetical protein